MFDNSTPTRSILLRSASPFYVVWRVRIAAVGEPKPVSTSEATARVMGCACSSAALVVLVATSAVVACTHICCEYLDNTGVAS